MVSYVYRIFCRGGETTPTNPLVVTIISVSNYYKGPEFGLVMLANADYLGGGGGTSWSPPPLMKPC